MDETVIPPSPNWFQVSGMAVSADGCIAYGGPSKSLCILEPLPADHDGVFREPGYHAHVFNRCGAEKITSVALSPDWPTNRYILTGSQDGIAKHWNLEKQGPKSKVKQLVSHTIHNQEKEEIVGVAYSTEVLAVTVGSFGNVVRWDLTSNVVKTFTYVKGFKPLCMACSPHLSLHVAIGTKQGVVFLLDLNGNGKLLYKVRGQDDEIMNISWCPQFEVALQKTLNDSDKRVNIQEKPKKGKERKKEQLDRSGIEKNLPEDSFDATKDEVEVPEDDMFDIYTDHAADEFGHKKYEPEEILVKDQIETKQEDFLAECLRLKDEILKRKEQGESSIQTLVDALDNTHVDEKENDSVASNSQSQSVDKCSRSVCSAHIHKHLLATIGKQGGVRIWSKSGKLVSSCVIPCHAVNKNMKVKLPYWPTVLWHRPDVLLMADGKSQLLECNPLKIDCKNKLDWSVVHTLHKRGLYCIMSNAPRVQTGKESPDTWNIYTASQDRNIILYSLVKKDKVAVISTSGGYIYKVLPCPYDAGKIALSVGDGAVRVWETSTLEDDDTKLSPGQVTTYWQNVQGKVLTIAWHPTRENMLAFATAESRIGLLDVGGKVEKPAKVLLPALSGSIYSISWGEGYDLFACANGDLVVYRANKPDEAPTPLPVEHDGAAWAVSCVSRAARGLAAGSAAGAVAVLDARRPHRLLAAALVFGKMIHSIEWHPLQTTNSAEESPYKNLMAVCCCERHGNIAILEYTDKDDGTKQLQTFKTLSGHRSVVLQLAWNPHREGQLLSTSQDYTVRVWDVPSGTCTSIFNGHSFHAVCASWLPEPSLGSRVLSGGADSSLRLWHQDHFPADKYDDKLEHKSKKEKRKTKRDKKLKHEEAKEKQASELPDNLEGVAVHGSPVALKGPKKFLLPILHRPANNECLTHAARILFQKYLDKTASHTDLQEKLSSEIDSKEKVFSERLQDKASDSGQDEDAASEVEYNFEYLKIFGSINEVNEVLDKQLEQHLTMNFPENYMTLCIFRGHIDAVMQFAAQREMLCPYLLSIAPCVSYKYWKDMTQLYLAQIERFIAKGVERKFDEQRVFGGAVWRRAALQLAAHDARAAAAGLARARLWREAYVLCRVRYMDSIADEILNAWATERTKSGLYIEAAICHLVLGNLSEAAMLLVKMRDQECLNLAADIAKVTGQNMLLEHITEKKENIVNSQSMDKTEEILEQLPSRIELLMKEGNKIEEPVGSPEGTTVNGNVTKESS